MKLLNIYYGSDGAKIPISNVVNVDVTSGILDSMSFIRYSTGLDMLVYDSKGVFGDNIYIIDYFNTFLSLCDNSRAKSWTMFEAKDKALKYVRGKEIPEDGSTLIGGFDYVYSTEDCVNFTNMVLLGKDLLLRTVSFDKDGHYAYSYQKLYRLKSDMEGVNVNGGTSNGELLDAGGMNVDRATLDKIFSLGDGRRKELTIRCEESKVFIDISIDSEGKAIVNKIEDIKNGC